CRINIDEMPALRLGRHALRHAVGGEHHRCAGGNLVELLDENRSLALERLDDVAVMNDLMAHIDRRTESLEAALDDLHRALDSGAEAARTGKQNGQRR